MTGIQFLTDEKGRRVAVQIDLRKHRSLWEDFYDSAVAQAEGDQFLEGDPCSGGD